MLAMPNKNKQNEERKTMSVNKVMILGRLGQDPELKYTPSGTAVCNFSLATNDYWTDKSGQKQERTEWHRVVVWGKVGENCGRYLSKGRQAFVEGSLQTRQWEGKDGQKRYTTEVVARNVQFIGGTNEARRPQESETAPRGANGGHPETTSAQGAAASENYQVNTESNFTADDIPF